MRKTKRMLALGLAVVSIFLMGGCGVSKQSAGIIDYGVGLYGEPEIGEEIAVMTTNFGDIYIRLFPEYAPKAVENFVTHARDGYYDGVIFHRVMLEFMIQGGDPDGTGRGGESIWGGKFEDEFHPMAHHLRGALSMANAGSNTNGSQFFIVQRSTSNSSLLKQMADYPESYPPEFVEAYREHGGTEHLDFKHSVFGFVFFGMDVVDEIAMTETIPAGSLKDRPTKDVVIEGIKIISYEGAPA